MKKYELDALVERMRLVEESLPSGYTVQLGVVLTCIDEHAVGGFDAGSKYFRVADVVVDHNGDCVKNRWGFANRRRTTRL